MVTKMIDLQIASTDLAALVEQLTPDTEIILTKDDVPIARLIGMEESPAPKERIAGLGGGTMFIVSDDFDDPLPDEFWLGQE